MTAKAEEILSIVDVEIKRNGKRTKVSRKEAAAEILIRKALSGDVPSLRLLWGYIDGLPRQRIEMTGEGGGPVEVVFPQGFKGV